MQRVLVADFLNAHQKVSMCFILVWFFWFQDFEIIFLHTTEAVFLSYDNTTFFVGTEMEYKLMYRCQRVESLQDWHLMKVYN